MKKFGEWTFSEQSQKRLENICSQLPKGNSEDNPSLSWLVKNVLKNIKKEELKQKDSCASWSDVYYEPFTSEIYNDDFYNKYDKVQKDVKEKLNSKKKIKIEEMDVDILAKDNGVENIEKINTRKENAENEMAVDDHCGGADVEEIICLLVSKLNKSDPEADDVETLLKDLTETDLVTVVSQCWLQLHNDTMRMCLCSGAAKTYVHSVVLCRNALLPWLQAGLGLGPAVEPLSKMITLFPDVACKELIIPLLASETSLLVDDLFGLKDLMAHLKPEHWAVVLREFVSLMDNELQKWHVPVLTTLIEQSTAERAHIYDILNQVAASMIIVAHQFADNRDFGTLMIAIINALNQDSPPQLINHMTLIVQQYKGTLRFKAMKLLKSISK